MMERALIARLLAPIATHPAARGLLDDAAVLVPPLGRDLVLTHDMLAEGIHFLPDDPPGDIAHKLLAVNLSDLAALGARPLGVLLGLGLASRQDEAWLAAFTAGLAEACARWAAPLLGGDTIAGLDRLTLGLTAIGQVPPGTALARGGASAGDDLWVTGNIGDATLGLEVARGGHADAPPEVRATLLARYRRPEPRLGFGAALIGVGSACLDVSDGLLIDAGRMAAASNLAATIHLAQLPISRAAEALSADRLALATGGDDYELLFAAARERAEAIAMLARTHRLRVTRVGHLAVGIGLDVEDLGGHRIAPGRLGWEHGTRA